MTLAIKGLARSEAQRQAEETVKMLTGEREPGDPLAKICSPLLGVRHFPMRIKCATLAWHALLEILKN
jgi:nitrogen fixation NifU-like protein